MPVKQKANESRLDYLRRVIRQCHPLASTPSRRPRHNDVDRHLRALKEKEERSPAPLGLPPAKF